MGFWASKANEVDNTATTKETLQTGQEYPGFIPQGYVRPMPMREEHAVGSGSTNNIDRGDYDHGVTDHAVQEQDQIDQTMDSNAIDLEVPDGTSEKYKVPPVDVKLVNFDSNEEVEHNVESFAVPAGATSTIPIRVLGKDRRRRTVQIKTDVTTLMIVNGAQGAQGSASMAGYPVGTAGTTLNSKGEVYVANTAAGTAGTVWVLTERYVNIDPESSGRYTDS